MEYGNILVNFPPLLPLPPVTTVTVHVAFPYMHASRVFIKVKDQGTGAHSFTLNMPLHRPAYTRQIHLQVPVPLIYSSFTLMRAPVGDV